MPRKRKTTSLSPTRKPLSSEDVAAFSTNARKSLNLPPKSSDMSQSTCSASEEELLSSMSEMFSDLDPGVVYMVLSESDFKVDVAMDYLLELSTAAKRTSTEYSAEGTGFDSIAASLDDVNQQHHVGCDDVLKYSYVDDFVNFGSSSERDRSPNTLLTEDFDSSIQNEFEKCRFKFHIPPSDPDTGKCPEAFDYATYTSELPGLLSSSLNLNDMQEGEGRYDCFTYECASSQPELRKCSMQTYDGTSVDADNFAGEFEMNSLAGTVFGNNEASEHVHLKDFESANLNCQLNTNSDLGFFLGEHFEGSLEPVGNVSMTVEKSGSQGFCQQDDVMVSSNIQNSAVAGMVPESSSVETPKPSDAYQSRVESDSQISECPQTAWNPLACEFYPTSFHRFITPVAFSPGQWKPALDPRGLGRGVHFPPQVSSNAWIGGTSSKVQGEQYGNQKMHPITQSPVYPSVKKKKRLVGKVLLLLRGVPGSGKSTLARTLLEQNPGGIIICTDDYFCKNEQYHFDPNCLEEAHAWTQKQAKEAFEKTISPIIIDNTNIQAWEMKPYVAMAVQHKYTVAFREPDTWWKYKPKELERRNIHGVTKEKVRRMLNNYERHVSVKSIMNSSASSRSDLDRSFDQDEGDGENDSEVPTDAKEENTHSLSFTQCSLSGEEKPVLKIDSSLLLETITGYTAQGVSEPQKEKETENGDAGAEEGIVHEGSTVCYSGDVFGEEDVLLKSQDAKYEDNLDNTVATGSSIGCVMSAVTMPLVERTPEGGDIQPLKTPLENEQFHGMQHSSKEDQTQEERSSVLPSSLRPELLNFVGDWPIEQSMGQRTQRHKKMETSFSKQSCDITKATNQHPVESSKKASGESEVDSSNVPEKALHKTTREDIEIQDGRGLPSMSIAVSNMYDLDDISMPELLSTVGDWPVPFTLQQRHRWESPKTILNKDEVESKAVNHLHLTDLYTVEDHQRASDNTGELQITDTLTFQDNEMVTCEINRPKRPSQNRRACKQRKLALTFTQSSTSFSETREPLLSCESEGDVPLKCRCASSQTEPQEFALQWRIEKKTNAVSEFTKVLIGKAHRFKAKEMNATTDADSSEKIPYRVMHDKSTHVEESELIEVDEMENLKTLCKLFRLVSFDVLKDLYERCNKDIGWATNLLLDSGEKMHKEEEEGEDDDGDAEESCDVNADQAALEPCLTLLNESNKKNVGSFDENTQNVAQSALSQQSESNIKPDCTTEREMDEAKQESGSEGTDLVMSQSSSSTTKGPERTHIIPSTELEISGKSNTHSFVFAKPPEAHACLEDIEHKLHPSVNKLEMQPLDDMDPCSLNTSYNSWKLKLDDQVATDPLEAELNESYKVDDEKNSEQPNSQVVLSEQQETWNSKENQHISEFTNVFDEGADEENKITFQEVLSDAQNSEPSSSTSLNIDCLQLSLPPELAFQLRELFGPVGIDLGSLTVEDCVVHIDLNLAKVIHEKWKESIMQRQQQETLSYQLIMEDEQFWLDNPELPPTPQIADSKQMKKHDNMSNSVPDLVGSERRRTFAHQEDFSEDLPFMDHWNTPTSKVSLRKIMSEEVAFQKQQDLKQVSPRHRKDGAAIVKEKQLFQMFPHVDEKLLMDIFKDSNYSLEQTEMFFKSVLEADPVENIVAPEIVQQSNTIQLYSADISRAKRKKSKVDEDIVSRKYFQDIEDPEYEDFRTEAFLHRNKQQECFRKAAEAFARGMKEVATFYAQQGHIHGHKMKEANHLAALQIFNRVNESLLPENVLDLHGLHVDEAMNHMRRILQEKVEEYKTTGGKPYLSVITGRGNHSQGGVARIKPAVIDYLNHHNFRFKEMKSGCLQVMLK